MWLVCTCSEDQGELLLTNSMEGFNSCLFAYGQTGSGKSHSVLGTPTDRGLLPRVCDGLFKRIKESVSTGTAQYHVVVTYLEIYNEKIKDLLIPVSKGEKALEIRQHPTTGVYIPGLTESVASSFEDIESLLDFGTKNRTIAATNMNAVSSRSHAVFSLKFTQTLIDENQAKKQRRSQINLVDLAGSERQKKTGAAGDRLKEGAAINQSLSNLGTVISALAEISGGKKGTHVPFRNSKLTYLLSDSLSGNSKTVMIAALSPAKSNYEETLSTLRFAQTCKKIKTNAKKNEESDEKIVASLQKEIERLKVQLRSGGGGLCDADAIQKELAERVELVNHYKTSWEDMVRKTEQMNRIRKEAMSQMGLHSADIGTVFEVDRDCPYLLNISDDPMLSGCLMYFIKSSEPTKIGNEECCTITLKGLGVHGLMCTIYNCDNEHLLLSVPLDPEIRVLVNGKRVVTEETRLSHHDRVVIGRAFAFRLVVPRELATIRSEKMLEKDAERSGGSAPAWDLDRDLGEIVDDDSQEFDYAKIYIEDLRGRVGDETTQQFLETLGCIQKSIDEANEITEEVRPKDRLRFSIDVLTCLYADRVDDPEFVVRLCQEKKPSEKFQGIVRGVRKQSIADVVKKKKYPWKQENICSEVLHAWEVDKFMNRLELMRDVYQQYLESGAVKFMPETDPWLEVSPAEISRLMDSQKLKAEILQLQAELHEREEEVQSLRLALEGVDALGEGSRQPSWVEEESASSSSLVSKPSEIKPTRVRELKEQNVQEIRKINDHTQEIEKIFGNMEDMYNEWAECFKSKGAND